MEVSKEPLIAVRLWDHSFNSLVETLEPFLQGHGISETNLLEDLGTLKATNGQAVAVWKYIVIYQDKQKKGTLF